jgi:NADPH:quinone reductase-like Zn-dependent oxidoreductase
MKAITLNGYGGPETRRLTELPDPKVAPGEVLVRVKAAGVNPVDWKLAEGRLDAFMETHFPLVPGWDVAGVVEQVGDVEEFAPGDEVFGCIRKDAVQFGAYAELVSAHVRMLALKPAALTWEQAVGVPLVGLTAYQAIKRVGVRAGDTVLVHAAAGGVGSLGVQIAVALGARVIGAASVRNHDYVRQLGAEPVTYGGTELVDRVAQLAPGGVDAALDFVGAGAVDASLHPLGRPERLASIADPEAAAKGGHYVWVRPDPVDLSVLADLADRGQLGMHVEKVLPLDEAAEAWRLSSQGHTFGKLVLSVDGR